MTQNNQRAPFQERNQEATSKVNKGVKLKNKNPVPPSPKIQQKEQLQENAQRIVADQNKKLSETKELAQQFLDLLRDKKLAKNKTQINLEVEKEVQQKLINFLIELNNAPEEEQQNDGMGSATICMLILKSLFIQRDRMNELEYRLETMHKNLESIVKNQNSSGQQ